MKKILFPTAILILASAGPASASHVNNLDTPFASRGACESFKSQLSQDDREWLQEFAPFYFSSDGEVMSFLNRAFTCERNSSDGQYYITDHRIEVIDSDWFQRRL